MSLPRRTTAWGFTSLVVALMTACATAAAALAGCPAPVAEAALPSISGVPGTPDDLASAPDGSLWVSEVDDDVIYNVTVSGRILSTIREAGGPEGVVVLPDGRLAVAEQVPNRIVLINPATGAAPQALASLPAAAGQLGVDGIGYDAAHDRLLVPDSPMGTLLAVSITNGAVETLATGMGRIVDAAVGPDGAIYAVAETTSGLQRVPAGGGTAVRVGTLTDLDDVVSLNGLLYVSDLRGAVWAVDPTAGADRELVTAASAPQGLIALGPRLVLADETTRAIAWVNACG